MAVFNQRTQVPSDRNPFYISYDTPNGVGITGYNHCIVCGDYFLNVLPNCVGYACGRFNEIIGEMKFPSLSCNARNFIKRARESYPSLQISEVPTLGGIMVWDDAAGKYGHVAVVESIADDGNSCEISESNYGAERGKTRFWRRYTIKKDNGWLCQADFKFLGCIVNPAVSGGNVANLSDWGGWSGATSGGSVTAAEYSSFLQPRITKNVDTESFVTRYEEVTTKLTRETLKSTDEELVESRSTHLLSYPSLVEAPFILVKIGNFTFGSYSKKGDFNKLNSNVTVDYPNFMDSIDIVKVNGTVNQYTISMTYQIQAGEDPNFLEKVFSSVGYGNIYISYGDWMNPSFIYKEEEALITKVTSSVDFSGSKIQYTVYCTSNSLALLGGTFNFPARKAKPSDVIKEILYNNTYGVGNIFYGMTNKTQVLNKNLIASDDRTVQIEAKESIDPLSYINYLVTCMTSNEDSTESPIKTSTYYLTIHDDTYGEENMSGPYFKITKVKADGKALASADTYELDIGYPSDNLVTSFSLRTDNSWALLYNYSENIDKQNYIYRIDDEGKIITQYSPALTTSAKKFRTTATQKDWWTNMTQFPVTAQVTIRGLVRPAMLMTKIRINAFFYGQRHISSGLYIVNKQEDKIDRGGYRTILSLTRIAGDQDWFEKETKTVKSKVPYIVYNN